MALGILTVFFIDFLTAVGFYLIVIFCPVYFQVKQVRNAGSITFQKRIYLSPIIHLFHVQEFVGLSRRQAMSVHTCNMVIYAILIPVGGLLSDRLGRINLIVGSAAVLGLLAWPLWMLLSTPDSIIMAFEGQVRE